jgi:predicted metal-dependent hydrolase
MRSGDTRRSQEWARQTGIPASRIIAYRMNDDAGVVEQWFQHGLELFNQQSFFASHEAWEQAWKSSQGQRRLCYQGLIQLAAALLHAQRHNWRGALGLWAKAEDKLSRLPPDFAGLALDDLRRESAAFFEACGKELELPPMPKLHRAPI